MAIHRRWILTSTNPVPSTGSNATGEVEDRRPLSASGSLSMRQMCSEKDAQDMSIHISSNNASETSAGLHLLPCSIATDGPAKVHQFFQPKDTDKLSTTFRGRELAGKTLILPESHTGIVLTEPNRPFTEDQDRNMKITSTFDRFTYWNLQTPPSEQDKVVRALQWASIASVIHDTDEKCPQNGQ